FSPLTSVPHGQWTPFIGRLLVLTTGASRLPRTRRSVTAAAQVAADRASGVANVRDDVRSGRAAAEDAFHRPDHADRSGRQSAPVEDRRRDRGLADHGLLPLRCPAALTD